MKKCFLSVFLVTLTSILFSAAIQVSPGQVFVGTTVRFHLQTGGDAAVGIRWDFGDGAVSPNASAEIDHIFREPGNYHVVCTWDGGGTTDTSVTVNDNRRVSPQGNRFRAGSAVRFRSENFVQNQLRWEFGDGSVETGGPNHQHVYPNPGSYSVRVFDFAGQTNTAITCSLNVEPDNRQVSANPPAPQANRKVDFTASQFAGQDLRWNFGDGRVENGGSSVSHVYLSPGVFEVQVWEGSEAPETAKKVSLNVTPDNRSVNVLTPNPAVYLEIDFSADNFSSGQLQWDFGDGTVIQGGKQTKHSYSSPGSIKVKVSEVGPDSFPVEITVAIGPDIRRIELAPSGAVEVGATVSIRLVNSNAGTVDWRIGTEQLNGSPPAVSHQFTDPGSIDIVCTVPGQPPLNTRIVVNDRRVLQVSPQDVFEGSQVAFEAVRFASPSMRWDFGDGKTENGGNRMNHRFSGAGSYSVKVYDFNGQSRVPVEKRIQVLPENREIVLKNQFVYVNSEIELEASNFRDSSIRWDFGDGMALPGARTMKHRFNRPGSFSVRAVDFGGQDGKSLEKNILVENDTRDIVFPTEWIEGEAADVALKNVSPGNYIWRFSNGESRSGNSATGVRFSSAGPFQVTISDPSGKYPPLEKNLLVKKDSRALKSSVPYALPVEEVVFTATGFKGPSVKWNFGDGTVKEGGTLAEKHTFNRTGKFKVTAVDFSGKSSKVFSQEVQIAEILPDFDITTLELTFDNGKYYRVIPKNSAAPGYQLRIKARGRGILQGNLQLDDQSLGLFQIILYENQTGALAPGQKVPLPVLDQGIHRLTVKFSNFSFGKPIPVIKYFVSLGGAIQIRYPLPDSKVARVPEIRLQWESKKKNTSFEIAVSEVPFQFLADKQIEWKPVEKSGEFKLDLTDFKTGNWVYWQVREVDGAGLAINTSEIAAFKLVGAL